MISSVNRRLRSKGFFAVCWLIATTMLAGCQGVRTQSSLHPAGPAAESIADLWWLMLGVLGVYTLAVFGLTGIAIFRGQGEKAEQKIDRHDGRKFILVGGLILPAMILTPTLAYTVYTTSQLRLRDAGLVIHVVGHRWWWQVEYPGQEFETANQLTIPVGQPVMLQLESADVIHSFWVPQLHGKMDMIPGKPSTFWLQANRAGVYRGQCAEYCGLQHAHMAFVVVALPPDEFVQWLADQQQISRAQPRSDSEDVSGFQLFQKHGCAVCHQIDGTAARGWSGPNLTHLADRKTLAAGTIENTPENLLRWLIAPQAIKPGVNMPPTQASDEDLRTIVKYLLRQPSFPHENGDGG